MILLDTSIVIAIALDEKIVAIARHQLAEAADNGTLFVSAITAWELGLLATRTGRTGSRLGNAEHVFRTVVAAASLQVIALSSEAALDAAYLPEPCRRDPSDRMIIATARIENLSVATNDRKILDYAALGHVRAIAC